MGMSLWGESPLQEYRTCRMRQGYPIGRWPMQGSLRDEPRRLVRKRNDGATKCGLCMPTTELVREQKRQCLRRRWHVKKKRS